MTGVKLLLLHNNSGNHLTVCKQMRKEKCSQMYLVYKSKPDLALNNWQCLI